MLRGIRRYAETKPDWLFTPVSPKASTLALLRRLQPAGLIAHLFSASLAQRLLAFRRPLVNTASFNASPRLRQRHVPHVGADNHQIGRLAATYLLDRGLRHFGFIGPPHNIACCQREASFRQVLEAAGHSLTCFDEAKYLAYGQLYRLWAPDAPLLHWLRAAPKPIGIFACQDAYAAQVVGACRSIGIRVPDEAAVLGVDNDDLLCELTRPALSSIDLPHERIGYEAAALLDRLLRGEKPRAEAVLFPPLGVVGRLSTDVLSIADADVAAAVRFIREHGHSPLRVRDVLRETSVSRRALERRFRQALQHGLGAEIRRVHMERAKALLAGTDLPMPQIAQRAGFSNAKHLATTFRLEVGLSPSAYRRQLRPQ